MSFFFPSFLYSAFFFCVCVQSWPFYLLTRWLRKEDGVRSSIEGVHVMYLLSKIYIYLMCCFVIVVRTTLSPMGISQVFIFLVCGLFNCYNYHICILMNIYIVNTWIYAHALHLCGSLWMSYLRCFSSYPRYPEPLGELLFGQCCLIASFLSVSQSICLFPSLPFSPPLLLFRSHPSDCKNFLEHASFL